MASSNSFFSYTDATGVEVIVQRVADVPEGYRAQVKHIDLSKPAITIPSDPGETLQTVPAAAPGQDGKGTLLHVPSFILGAGAAVLLGLVVAAAFRRAHRFISLAAAVVVMAALGIGYLTYARQWARLQGKGLATPATLLDDARAAAGALNERNREQERVLNDVDRQR